MGTRLLHSMPNPVLVLPDLTKPFEIECDGCNECLGAVLLQEGHAIAYESQHLNEQDQSIYFMSQTKLSDKQMRWENFLSQFHFHIAHIPGKHNTDALSCRPMANAISVAYHNDLSSMVDAYAMDLDFANVMSALSMGKTQDPYVLKDGSLLYGSRLCVTKDLGSKVMLESHRPVNEGHRSIQAY